MEAGEKQQADGKFIERDFLSIPTFTGGKGQFVYAVPKGHAERALEAAAAPILAEYQRRRAGYIGADKPGTAYLLRDWFDDGTGVCRVPNGDASKHSDPGRWEDIRRSMPARRVPFGRFR